MAQDATQMEARFARETGPAGEIAALAEPVLEGLGLRLVRVIVSGRDGGTVQVMAERADGTMTIDDCATVSRQLSPLLDAHDPIPGRYNLEVSSPGIDRPLVRPADFEMWAGYDAKVELKELVDGRKRFRGRIEGFEHGEVRLEVDLDGQDGPHIIGFPVDMIASAKLVMSERLLKASLAGAASPGEERPRAAAQRK